MQTEEVVGEEAKVNQGEALLEATSTRGQPSISTPESLDLASEAPCTQTQVQLQPQPSELRESVVIGTREEGVSTNMQPPEPPALVIGHVRLRTHKTDMRGTTAEFVRELNVDPSSFRLEDARRVAVSFEWGARVFVSGNLFVKEFNLEKNAIFDCLRVIIKHGNETVFFFSCGSDAMKDPLAVCVAPDMLYESNEHRRLPPRIRASLCHLVMALSPDPVARQTMAQGFDIRDTSSLYKAIEPAESKLSELEVLCEDLPAQHDQLIVLKRIYQVQATWWMLRRENALPSAPIRSELQLHPRVIALPPTCGYPGQKGPLYFNMDTGLFSFVPVHLDLAVPGMKGGILADEMGLGKTIVTIDLVLRHPHPDETLKGAVPTPSLYPQGERLPEPPQTRVKDLMSNRNKAKSKRKKQKTNRSHSRFQHQEWCHVCKIGGELYCCAECPRVYHRRCLGPFAKALKSDDLICPQHFCIKCGDSPAVDRGMLFRCLVCPCCKCKTHVEPETKFVSNCPTFIQSNYNKPVETGYMLCSQACIAYYREFLSSEGKDISSYPTYTEDEVATHSCDYLLSKVMPRGADGDEGFVPVMSMPVAQTSSSTGVKPVDPAHDVIDLTDDPTPVPTYSVDAKVDARTDEQGGLPTHETARQQLSPPSPANHAKLQTSSSSVPEQTEAADGLPPPEAEKQEEAKRNAEFSAPTQPTSSASTTDGKPPAATPEPPSTTDGKPPAATPEPPSTTDGKPPAATPEPPSTTDSKPPAATPEPPSTTDGKPPAATPELVFPVMTRHKKKTIAGCSMCGSTVKLPPGTHGLIRCGNCQTIQNNPYPVRLANDMCDGCGSYLNVPAGHTFFKCAHCHQSMRRDKPAIQRKERAVANYTCSKCTLKLYVRPNTHLIKCNVCGNVEKPWTPLHAAAVPAPLHPAAAPREKANSARSQSSSGRPQKKQRKSLAEATKRHSKAVKKRKNRYFSTSSSDDDEDSAGDSQDSNLVSKTRTYSDCLQCQNGGQSPEHWVQCSVCFREAHSRCVRVKASLERRGFGQALAPVRRHFVCATCTRHIPLLESATTLIVSPNAIVEQWRRELLTRVKRGALKVFRYHGVKEGPYVCPYEMAQFDIVLTTFKTLHDDLNHCAEIVNPRQSRRFRKKYEFICSPLTRLNFWRICVDEAQMVEAQTDRATRLVQKLASVHRWAITGTPIRTDYNNLFGLVKWLQVPVYQERDLWDEGIEEMKRSGVDAPLTKLLCNIMWRHQKNNPRILQQMRLPPQTEFVYGVRFGPIEIYNYKQLEVECRKRLVHIISNALAKSGYKDQEAYAAQYEEVLARLFSFWNTKLSVETIDTVLAALRLLRQTCDRPQVNGAKHRAPQKKKGIVKKSPLTMNEVAEKLMTKAKQELDGKGRSLVACLNGLGDFACLRRDYVEGISYYAKLRTFILRHKDWVTVDILQRLHCVFNEAKARQDHECDRDWMDQRRWLEVRRSPMWFIRNLKNNSENTNTANALVTITGNPVGPHLTTALKPAEVDVLTVGIDKETGAPVLDGAEAAHAIDALISEATKLSSAYLTKFETPLTRTVLTARELLLEHMSPLEKAEKRQFGFASETPWWWVIITRLDDELKQRFMQMVFDRLSSMPSAGSTTSVLQYAKTPHELGHALEIRWAKLLEYREKALYILGSYCDASVPDDDADVLSTQNCRSCTKKGTGPRCKHCEINDLCIRYQRILFDSRENPVEFQNEVSLQEHQEELRGELGNSPLALFSIRDRKLQAPERKAALSKLPSELEMTLRVLLQFIKDHKEVLTAVGILDDITDDESEPDEPEPEPSETDGATDEELSLDEEEPDHDDAMDIDENDAVDGSGRRVSARVLALRRKKRAEARAAAVKEAQERREAEAKARAKAREKARQKRAAERKSRRQAAMKAREAAMKARKANRLNKLLERAETHIRFIDMCKTEFDLNMQKLREHRDYVRAIVEVEQALHCLEIADDSEVLSAQKKKYSVRWSDKMKQENTLRHSLKSAQSEVLKARSQFEFLKHNSSGKQEVMCPICQDVLEDEAVYFVCGHSVCEDCCERLIRAHKSTQVVCPECRRRTPQSELVTVSLRGNLRGQSSEQQSHTAPSSAPSVPPPSTTTSSGIRSIDISEVKSHGCYGAKVDGVVAKLLQIQSEDSMSKSIVFSEWPEMLDVLALQLRNNHISFVRVKSRDTTHLSLTSFKEDPSVRVLLMTISAGSRGLNLVEARHVLMLEPILNPAADLQAVGRVHRIGQVDNTFVHRFVVHDTVEVQVLAILHAKIQAIANRSTSMEDSAQLTVGEVMSLVGVARPHA